MMTIIRTHTIYVTIQLGDPITFSFRICGIWLNVWVYPWSLYWAIQLVARIRRGWHGSQCFFSMTVNPTWIPRIENDSHITLNGNNLLKSFETRPSTLFNQETVFLFSNPETRAMEDNWPIRPKNRAGNACSLDEMVTFQRHNYWIAFKR